METTLSQAYQQSPSSLFTLQKIIHFCGNVEQKIQFLTEVFIQETVDKDLVKMKELIDEGNHERLFRLAHKMKSSIGLYGIENALELIIIMEGTSKVGDIEQARFLYPELQKILFAVKEQMNQTLNNHE